MKPEHALRLIEEVQSLTYRYAAYKRRKGGLGYVFGGMVLLIVSLLAMLVKPGIASALTISGLTLLWLMGKEALRRWLYTPHGNVKERLSPEAHQYHLLRVVLGTLLTTGILFSAILQHTSDSFHTAVILSYPLTVLYILLFCLQRPVEWLLGLSLLLINALALIGAASYFQWLVPLAFVLALVSIALGAKEHFQFQVLIKHMQAHQQRYTSSNASNRQSLFSLQRPWLLFSLPLVGIALSHPLLAAPLCAGSLLLLLLQERVSFQPRIAPVHSSYITKRFSCSMMPEMRHL